ncbi:MAG: AAA family ATPase [Alphaproteobacteria bacterium]|nr:AAA family ATPase [Alphaproteobacteria bacterium]
MVIDDILKWSGGLHDWQKDALRRICSKEELDETDVDELTSQIKKKAGIDIVAPASVPLNKTHLGANSSNANLHIKEIKNVKNVNALISKTELKFKPDGLTVVYGPNGSGKTGFIRILRHACRTRINDPKKLKILSNVYGTTSATPKEAEIVIGTGGADKTLKWKEDSPAIEDLLQATVFDTHAANLYVDEGNQIRFLPFGLNLPYKLNAVCMEISSALKEEKKADEAQLALTEIKRFPANDTKAKKFYAEINAKTTDAQIDTACQFPKKSQDRLKEIETLLSSNKQRLTEIESLKKWSESLKTSIENYASLVSDEMITKLKALKKAYVEAEQAANFAAEGAFKDEPVQGVGSVTWEKLWAAAKAYSETEAYLGKQFPLIEEEDSEEPRCVLCHQTLDDDAKKRLGKFHDFVKSTLAEEAKVAKKAYDDLCEKLQNAKILSNEGDDIRLKQVEEKTEDLAKAINTWAEAAQVKMKKILKLISSDEEEKYGTLSNSPALTLKAFIETLENEKVQVQSAFDEKKRNEIIEEKAELEATKVLSEEIANIKKRRDFLSKIDQLDQAINLTATKSITQKANELIDIHLTTAVDKKFEAERKDLDIVHLNIKLKRESDKTGANFKTATEASIKCNASDVLSEGEQKALALAAFLTETHIVSPNGPIILDDPVSSLDRKRSTKVAKRLAEEAQNRQVIVFTHDIIFYNEICGIAQDLNIAPACISIFSTANGSGFVDPAGEPWKGKPVSTRLNLIKNDFQSIRKLHTTSPSDYEYQMKNLYGRLRDTYERAVEEKIFKGIVVRYNDIIQTKMLRYIDFSDDLAKMFHDGMTKANTFSHDNPQADNVQSPDPKEFDKDIQDFEAFLNALDQSYTDCGKRRAYMK